MFVFILDQCGEWLISRQKCQSNQNWNERYICNYILHRFINNSLV